MQQFNCYEHMFRNYAKEFIDEMESGYEWRGDRTGVGRYLFKPCVINIQPHVWPEDTSRKLYNFWKYEFNAFAVHQSSDIKDLGPYSKVWEPWADDYGCIGKFSYPSAFRHLDRQIGALIKQVENDSFSTTVVLTTWINSMAEKVKNSWKQLNPGEKCKHIQTCHGSFVHLIVDDDGNLNMNCVQRSADIPLGVPYNLLFYKQLLLYVVYRVNNEMKRKNVDSKLKVGEIEYIISAPHFYTNQLDAVKEQYAFINKYIPVGVFGQHDMYNRSYSPVVQSYSMKLSENGWPRFDRQYFDVVYRKRHSFETKDIKYPKAAV